MKKKGIVSALLSVMICLTACGSGSEMQEYVRGTAEDGSFASEWLGIRFHAPEGYIMMSEEELDAALLSGIESYRERHGEDGEALLGSAAPVAVYELMAYLPDGSDSSSGNPNIILTVERSSGEPETYAEELESQIDMLYAGASITWEDAGTVKIGGLDYSQYTMEADYGILELCQRYYLAKKDDRLISFILSYTQDKAEDADALMGAFMAY